MSVATDLQNIIASVSAAIATGQPLQRPELEVLRRNLNAAAASARTEARDLATRDTLLGGMIEAIESGVLGLNNVAAATRAQLTTANASREGR